MEILLGAEAAEFQGCKLRKTPGIPNKVSVIDLISVVTQNKNPHQTLTDLRNAHPEGLHLTESFKFKGRGQQDTPVADARGAVVILNLLQGARAAAFRLKAADIVVRALGGDETLVSEIRANAAAQAVLPEDHPMRFFGQAVEAEQENRKRSLEDDEEIYAAKKQQLLRQISQQTIREQPLEMYPVKPDTFVVGT